MYTIKGRRAEKIEAVSFADLGMQENDIEEILRCSIDMLCDEEESMLIVGRQVRNAQNGRSDLTAVDNEGNVVLIEIKRDRKDIQGRKEAFEFQAIRYAASYATINSPEELVKKVYAPYIDTYRCEYQLGELTPFELGIRQLVEFLRDNEVETSFNRRQRIILVASEFDPQTLSAVAWLNSNAVDMSCHKLTPYRVKDEVYLLTEKLLPVTNDDDYFVNLMDKSTLSSAKTSKNVRRKLPKIDAMLEWGVVKAGDVIGAKGRDNQAILQPNGNVVVDGKEQSMQAWLKGVYRWSSVQTYVFAVHLESGKTLSQIRQEYMDELAEEAGGKIDRQEDMFRRVNNAIS